VFFFFWCTWRSPQVFLVTRDCYGWGIQVSEWLTICWQSAFRWVLQNIGNRLLFASMYLVRLFRIREFPYWLEYNCNLIQGKGIETTWPKWKTICDFIKKIHHIRKPLKSHNPGHVFNQPTMGWNWRSGNL